jgi:drug/metabolite transporter (DMT)-like permease
MVGPVRRRDEMQRKDRLDRLGLGLLLVSTLIFGINQVVIKVVDTGLQPVFFAGLRSLGAFCCIWAWMAARGRPPRIAPGTMGAGLLVGLAFSAEFLCLFLALDRTTVVMSSIVFYSMPLWLAVIGHFFLPGERITRAKAVGLALAFTGVAWALGQRGGAGTASLVGDLFALGAALGWALTAFIARGSAMARVRPEMQLLWMVGVSGPVLLVASVFFGPWIRALSWLHVAGLAFQILVVVAGGMILWLWLLARYPAATVASFSFLTPLLSIGFGWLLLGEPVGPRVLAAGGLVAAGLVLIARAPRGTGAAAGGSHPRTPVEYFPEEEKR